MRIHKFLATSGVCSRREAERLVAEGVVTINGIVAKTGQPVNGEIDQVRCRGQLVKPLSRTVVLMMNKPRGFLCTNDDTHGGHTVFEMVPPEYKELRLFCVGRLDKDSEGLLLLTNDGDLANKVMHPSGGVIKRYEILLNRDYDPTLTPRLIKGAFEEGEHLRFKKVIRHPDNPASLEIHLDQGRKREIRRLFEIFGFHVKTLRRFQIGELVLRKMPLGDCRPLARKEIDMIFEN
ncbi:MAG: rRNA pseudouridine synthase [Verrucomicrobia bacterium]|nr:rRNA pseudouridine synthase [Verrucomicrobiota bacterium]NBS04385.1 rRNA pseudouridine synthase [Verrucomicrobiota bacterium]NBY37971.1 rRNA pseudouridine synthase [Verrucomicrobiota bacterium]